MRSLGMAWNLLLLQALMLLMVSTSSSEWISPSALGKNWLTCNESHIPYPFGISGRSPAAAKGFEVNCSTDNGSPNLQLVSGGIQLLNISLDGSVLIVGGLTFHQCYDSIDGSSDYASPIDLRGSPYTFSDTENKFTVVGCDAMSLIQASGDTNYTSGCVTFCTDRNNATNGFCSGIGCCQASIPKDMKHFRVKSTSIRNISSSRSADRPCSRAFLVKQDQFFFDTNELESLPLSKSESVKNLKFKYGSAHNYQYHPVVLNWTIGNETCEQAKQKVATFACKNNSYCNDSPHGNGYRCSCNKGFTGNPYVQGGCKDID